MFFLRGSKGRRTRTAIRRASSNRYRRFGFEVLQDRWLLTNLFVTSINDNGSGSLRDAVATANSDARAGNSDTIKFNASLNGQTITLSSGPLDLGQGGAGSGTITIDGAQQITVSGNNASRVIQVENGVSAALLGLTISGGNVGTSNNGGGIYSAGTLLLSNCTITGNTAASGAGIENDGSNSHGATGILTVSNCVISWNTSTASYGSGAGIDNLGTLSVNNSTFLGNSDQFDGGAIYNYGDFEGDGTATISNSTFSQNSAWYGGAILNYSGSLTITESTFSNNKVAIGFGVGGAIGVFTAGTLMVSDSTFSGNYANQGGAIGLSDSGVATITNATFFGNGAYKGGAIAATADTVNLSNCTISANYAISGGTGGGIYSTTMELFNTIVAGNITSGTDPDLFGSLQAASSDNFIGDGTGMTGVSNGTSGNQVGSGAYPIDPMLGPLQNNGGLTQTMALVTGSPAINAGGAITMLTADATSTDTTLSVGIAGAVAITSGDYLIQIDSEQMLVTNVNLSTNTLTVTRGYNGTTATSHSFGASIELAADQTGRPRIGAPDIGAFEYGSTLASLQYSLPLNQTVTGQLKNLFTEDQWTFAGVAGQQLQFVLLNAGSSNMVFTLTGPNGYSAFINANSSSQPFDLPDTGSYVLTVNTVGSASSYAYAFQITQSTTTPLTLGTPYQGTLSGNAQAQLFALTVSSPTLVSLLLTDAQAGDQNEVYVSLGSAPTRDTYQFRYSTLGANQTVSFAAVTGTYYILVYNNLVVSPGSSYTLEAENPSFKLLSGGPSQIGNYQPTTLQVTGIFPLAFQSPTAYQLQFVSSGGSVYPIAPLYLSPTGNAPGSNGSITMSATLPAFTLPADTYSERVVDSFGDSQTLANTLTVTAGGAGLLKTSISVPSWVGWGSAATIYVTYTNDGTAPMAAPLLVVTATMDDIEGACLTIDPSLAGVGIGGYATYFTPAGFAQSVQFLASGAAPGILNPGESKTVPVYYGGWLYNQRDYSNPYITFTAGEIDTTNTQTIDWSTAAAGLQLGSINTAAWNAIAPIVTAGLGNTWGQYIQTLDNDATYLASIGQPTNDLNDLLSFEVEKANASYTSGTLLTVTPESLSGPGLDFSFTQSFQQSISGRYTSGILGYGWTDNWDQSAATMANGDVLVTYDGASLYFALQPGGTYKQQGGDQSSTLQNTGGAYKLVITDGTIYQFNANGTLNYVQDTHGNRITAGYNSQHQLVSLTHSNGEYILLAYNAQGLLASLTDSSGQTESYGYDATGHLTTYTDGYGTTTYTYSSGLSAAENGALTEVASPGGTHIYYEYDTQGRLIDRHLDNDLENQTWSYLTPGGYITADALGNATTVYYNLYGVSSETIDPLGNVTRYYYDNNLQLIKTISPGGVVNSYTYDTKGNLTSAIDPLGFVTTYTYDAHNNLTSYTDAAGNATSYSYDAANDLLSITYANGASQQYTYDPLGEATQYLNARGDAIGYAYNANGQLTKETFADGTFYQYTYNTHGSMSSATDANGNTTTFVYGNVGNPDLLTEVDYPDGTWLKFSYNAADRRAQSVDQTGFTTNYSYDAAGRLSELTDANGNLIVQYTYDAAGNLIEKDNGNSTRTVYTYDQDNNVVSITNYASNHTTVNSFDDYTYDALGNTLTDTNQDGQWVYTYDANSQLIQAVFTINGSNPDGLTNQNLQYVYDAVGNRVSQTINGVTTTYSVNNVNEYTSSITAGITTTYSYDADANLISQATGGDTTTYTFNDLSQLMAVSGPGLSASYTYDAIGDRVSQAIGGVTTTFQVDPIAGYGNVVATYTGVGALAAHYTYGLGLVSQVSSAGTAAYYDFNSIGNTVGVTDSTGSYVNKYAYLPFGQTTTIVAAIANSFTFIGQYGVIDDGGGNLDMRAREYDPTTGDFISADPMGLSGGANNRAYATDDPVGYSDPSGMCKTVTIYIWTQGPGHAAIDVDGHYLSKYGYGANPENSIYPWNNYPADYHSDGQAGAQKSYSFDVPDDEADDMMDQIDQLKAQKAAWNLYNSNCATDVTDVLAAGRHAIPGNVWTPAYLDLYLQSYNFQSNCPPPKPPIPPTTASSSKTSGVALAQDPNSMNGPAGYGAGNYVAADALLPYQIIFENDPSATAPAQRVDISDQLDGNLDWTTFQFTGVGFGSTYLSITSGLQHYDTAVSMTYNGDTFDVEIALDLNAATGIVTASFQSLDPSTLLPPTSVLTGFLPPEDGTGRGLGFISYTIQPKAGLTTGTQIRAIASITFDSNPAISTDQVNDEDPSQGIDPSKQALVTIDAGSPTSSVATLAATTNSASFAVNWSGSDDTGGSGIAFFDVYVAIDSGPFESWLTATPLMSATYDGANGHSYAFFSVAHDYVGNVETLPTTAEAQTTVNTNVILQGTTLTLTANSSSDNLVVTFTDATDFTVTLGTVSTSYTTAAVSKVVYEGEGDNSATVTDQFNPIAANLAPAALQVIGANYEVQTTGTDNNTVTATSGDTANLVDGPGNNRFYGTPTSSMLINTDAGTAYSETVNGFSTVNATGSSSSDTAYLYDAAGANTFYGHPTYALMTGSNYTYQVNSFPVVFAFQQSGTDTAYLYDSIGGSFDSHQTSSVAYGTGYYNSVNGFQVVEATMTSPNDTAFLYDTSGSNKFERHPASGGQPTYAVFYGAGFYNQVSGSLEVTATAGAGTTDQAYLNDGTNDSRLYAYPTTTTLTDTDIGSAFNFKVNNFGDVKATETGTSDTAYMYDSAGQDRFYGQPTESSMAGTNYWNVADGFGVAIGLSAGGGNDYSYLYSAKNDGTFYGYDTNSVMQGSNYYYQEKGFRYAFAYGAGGNTAFLSDSGGGATLEAHQASSVFSGSTLYIDAMNFVTVDATGNGNKGSDGAYLDDSPGNDHVNAAGDTAQILYPNSVVNVGAFANVLARSTLGGTDTEMLQAVDYNMAFTGNWT
jgi:RHS repeat-associated protein